MENLEAYLSWKHNPICKRTHDEWIRYEERVIESTFDGGHTWNALPWEMDFLSRIKRSLHRADWPPVIDCFGWFNGCIAIAWHWGDDSEMYIGKHLALFNKESQKWSYKYMGYFHLGDGTDCDAWFENLGFEPFNRVRLSLKKFGEISNKSGELFSDN